MSVVVQVAVHHIDQGRIEMTRSNWGKAAGAIGVALVLLLSACGDSDDATISRPNDTTSATTESRSGRSSRGDDRLIAGGISQADLAAPTTVAHGSATRQTAAPATTAAADAGSLSSSAAASDQLYSDSEVDRATSATTATTSASSRSREEFAEVEVGDFERTARDETSTFALDVDTASYSIARRAIFAGRFPDPSTVRVEEFVNAFDQDYPAPGRQTFAIYADGAPHDLVDDDTYVLRIGIASRDVTRRGRPDANLTIVVDVSGSMQERGKMTLVRDSLAILIDELGPDDRVAIVAYDARAWVVLEPTFVDRRNRILDAIEELQPGGSTNVDAGLRLGYELARDTFDEGLINKVILASDGVANTGNTDPDDMLAAIAEDAGRGIQMLAVGYGFNSYNDALLERLADAGNGAYAYVDSVEEAERLFADQLTSTLVTVALDAKVKVEFDSDTVRSWRLLGFENRAITDREFDSEGTDAGEIGAGHAITALYEIDLARGVQPGDNDVLGRVILRWIDPESLDSEELSGRIRATALDSSYRRAAPHLRWDIAVATTAELLRGSEWVDHVNTDELLDELIDIARDLRTDAADEFVDMVDQAVQMGL